MDSDELSEKAQALITQVALTLQKESNSLLFLDQDTVSTLICCLQVLLDGTHPSHTAFISGHRHILRRLLVKICRDTGILPTTLFLTAVSCKHPLHSVAGGSFSDIYRAELHGEHVALKRLRVFQADPSHRASQFKAFCREALIWRQLRHPHILSFLGVDTRTFEPSGLHCMVSPWMDNGSIVNCMAEREVDRWVLDRWVFEVAEGLEYLHSERVVHGDLRGANILVDANLSIKLSDFGLAKFADASTASWGTHAAGALRWMAPEVLGGTQATLASDVYSFGCVCAEIYTGHRPFAHITNDAHVVVQIMKGARPEMPSILSSSASSSFGGVLRSLMITCWNGAPATRPTAHVLVETLRPGVAVKEEFGSGFAGIGRVATPESYLRMSSARDGNEDCERTKTKGTRPSSNVLGTSTVFRPLQPQSLPPLIIPSNPITTSSSSRRHRTASTSRPAPPPEPRVPQFEWTKSPLVLVIDDTPAFHDSASRVLEDFGCIVEWARDGAQAMGMCDWSKTIFDMVFMRLNGASATSLIRDYDKKVPIIALSPSSSKSESVLHNHYSRVGMNDVLSSSPSSARLLGVIEKHLSHLRKPSSSSSSTSLMSKMKQENDPQTTLTQAYRKRQVSISSEVSAGAATLTVKRSRAF
ncbi:hypothetical protein EIP91_000948 [Steccherinum ochraceum]|uniref:Uncharacterized protein n=1 Tax=Steccherinum ochraceum TaxID=92696 RepID=A0A4R0RI78_9APHY|nr:hypothetical protein EIP91_000948 [Steccherinum ochraceum]